jgi:hypothetical protein
MAWLVGSSDIANLRADLYALLSGTMAAGTRGGGQAGNGVTVGGTDAWTALDGTNFIIRSQRTESPWTSEYGLYRGAPRFAARTTSTVFQSAIQTQLGKPAFSGAYSGGTARVYLAAFVSTANGTPGSLTGTVITWTLVNADTAATVASGTTSAWSGSTDTKLITNGISLTLTLGGSDQFVGGANAVLWLRGYTTTFTQGIDYFPEAANITGGITVSNTSGGSNNYTGGGTDYTLVQQVHTHPIAVADANTIAPFSAILDWGGNGCGCGIAWNAGGSPPAVGANYFIPADYSLYGAYYQVPNLVASTDYKLTGAPMDAWDATLAVGRWVMTSSTTTPKSTVNTTLFYGRVFSGVGQPTSTFINFWISVKSDKIVIILRGDPGQSGQVTMLTLQRATALVAADKHPWLFACTGSAPSTDGWFAYEVTSKYTYEQPYYGTPATTVTSLGLAMWSGLLSSNAGRTVFAGIPTASLPIQNPNNFDLRFWLYSIYPYCLKGGSNLAGTFDVTKNAGIRSKLQGIWVIALDNFSSLDTLADSSGNYLLFTPNSAFGAGSGSQAYTDLGVLNE